MSKYIKRYLNEVEIIAQTINKQSIESVIQEVILVKKNRGRIFFLGIGGSAANCSHAVNDFRKIAEIDSYTPIDNVAELTARINDEGWDTIFSDWLKRSNLNKSDLIFILSVGGGSKEKNISTNLVSAIDYAKKINVKIVGIVGRDGGYTAINSTNCIIVPKTSDNTITPQAESWQAVIWHLIVTDPRVQSFKNKWENIEEKKI